MAYTHFWHLEEDVAYTGDWGRLLRNLTTVHPLVDLLSKMEINCDRQYSLFRDSVFGRCHVAALKSAAGVGCCLSERCYRVNMHWPIARLSWRFVQHLNITVSNGAASGHHESVTAPLCLSTSWCIAAAIDKGYYANYSLGGGTVVPRPFGLDWNSRDGFTGVVSHPIKCTNHSAL